MHKEHFGVLDGWRGISILLVLAAHLLPLGPKAWDLNVAAGLLGMVLFFNLSGFLITHFLLQRPNVPDFLMRRFFRILPLAWLYMGLMLYLTPASGATWSAHFLFYANYPPEPLVFTTSHLWSLCVEVHFYLGIALLVGFFGKRGLMVIPLLCIAFTLLRVGNNIHYAVISHYRVDEILAGAWLALIYNSRPDAILRRFVSQGSVLVLAPLLLVACHPDSGAFNYLRPYLAAALIGVTMLDKTSPLTPLLQQRLLVYIAGISYALYVIHPFLMSTWLGSGEGLAKYAKRPLLFIVLFVMAHVSTFYYERPWIALGKKLSAKLKLGEMYGFK
ncbi:MAG TPA: acyltransferase [Methylophilaceae bacterium]|nr:acyltransferase [Methylophilaceae bacterium]